jgi:hypothetical protein
VLEVRMTHQANQRRYQPRVLHLRARGVVERQVEKQPEGDEE